MAQSSVSLIPEQMSWAFPSATGKWPCQHLPPKPMYWLKALSPRRMAHAFVSWENGSKLYLTDTSRNEWIFQLLQRNGHFKIILPLKLSDWLKALSPGRIAWCSISLIPEKLLCRIEASPVSLMNSLFKTIFPLKLLYQLEALSPRRPEQWMWRVSSPESLTNGYFKTIFQVYLYQMQELDSTLLVSF